MKVMREQGTTESNIDLGLLNSPPEEGSRDILGEMANRKHLLHVLDALG